MHPLLLKLLAKRQIKVEELTEEEKKVWDSWNNTLNHKKVTLDSLKLFCELQKSLIEEKFSDLDNSSQKNDRLVLMHTIYSKLVKATDADKAERESLEKYLTDLIDNT